MRGIGLVEIDLVGQVLSIHGNVEMVVDLVSHAGVKAPVGRDAACHDLRRGVHSNYAAGILRGRSIVLKASINAAHVERATADADGGRDMIIRPHGKAVLCCLGEWPSGVDGRNQNRGCGRSAIRSEEHTSELHSLMRISYSVFCLK